MDYKKLFKDIMTGNTEDLGKRFSLLNRRILRVIHGMIHRGKSERELLNIPVVINNRNRYTYLLQLIHWLENVGMKNIIILDNDSDFPPLLEYYKSCPHRVVLLKQNVGPNALWKVDHLKWILKDYYIYSDPDVLPDHPPGLHIFKHMFETLKQHKLLDKVGYALRIDDLPDHFALKKSVIEWESQFWKVKVNDEYFVAPVDTTFAMYAPYAQGGGECKSWRTNFPFVAKHLPWYENTNQPDAESVYYRTHAAPQNSHWTNLMSNS